MRVVRSDKRKPKKTDASVADALRCVSQDNLRKYVEMLAFPRHYVAEREANTRARNFLVSLLKTFGYAPVLQGTYHNIVATSGEADEGPFLLLGAHYDSVPGSPGADDNASALAVCLECARIVKEHDIGSTMIAFFNREEDGLIGSREFVAHLASQPSWAVAEAHVFEMVGFCTHAPGSQRLPAKLPIAGWDVGNFLALLANRRSNAVAENLVSLAATYLPQFPVAALKMYFGMENYFADLLRSDHAPFWEAGVAAIMWTDSSEFRNPHYHRASDTPDTLDYSFLAHVTKLALARAVSRSLL
jgi:Zn-dependent M28 family amino/carboxypeptidase